jgi:hypothetical protein
LLAHHGLTRLTRRFLYVVLCPTHTSVPTLHTSGAVAPDDLCHIYKPQYRTVHASTTWRLTCLYTSSTYTLESARHPPTHTRSYYNTLWKIPWNAAYAYAYTLQHVLENTIHTCQSHAYVMRPRAYVTYLRVHVTRVNKSPAHAFSKSATRFDAYKRTRKTSLRQQSQI